MTGTTLHISNSMIIINHEKSEETTMFDDGDKQTVVILMQHLCGFNINHTKKVITLYLNIRGMESYTVEFTRGCNDQTAIKNNFTTACTCFGVN